MIDMGVNPFLVSTLDDCDAFTSWNLEGSNLSNLPTKKSIYFTIRPLPDDFKDKGDFLAPWFYQTGFYGNCDTVIGQGASGVVLSGDWFQKKAAFKFVEIGKQKMLGSLTEDHLKAMDQNLSEMTWNQSTKGSKIISFYGHYR